MYIQYVNLDSFARNCIVSLDIPQPESIKINDEFNRFHTNDNHNNYGGYYKWFFNHDGSTVLLVGDYKRAVSATFTLRDSDDSKRFVKCESEAKRSNDNDGKVAKQKISVSIAYRDWIGDMVMVLRLF